ncbi:MAG TPA: ATP-binding protein [Pyrinomonadaceae bacterium]|nr:ATP-binding protein [Pyrinomonadaceae bacterium]
MSNFNPPWLTKPPVILSYGIAAAAVTITLMIGWWMETRFQSAAHVSLFLCAVMISAWFGGLKPAMLAVALSVLAFDYYFLPPIYSFAVEIKQLPRLFIFALSAVFAGSLTAAQRSAAESLRHARDDLNGTLQELQRTNEALQAENTERQRAEDALHRAQAELAHVTRVTTLGEMIASIAHEINQPLSGIITNGNASLRWLGGDPPNLDEVRDAARRIIRDGNRASEVIARIRALSKKAGTAKERLDLNQTIQEMITLTIGEVRRNGVELRTELAADIPAISGDRVELQQVVLNLIKNGIEAMGGIDDRARELLIKTESDAVGRVRVIVRDSGTGLNPLNMERIFDAFYTTKSEGMGMGLAISRSIVENHGGNLWAVPNDGPGATFQFTLMKYD